MYQRHSKIRTFNEEARTAPATGTDARREERQPGKVLIIADSQREGSVRDALVADGDLAVAVAETVDAALDGLRAGAVDVVVCDVGSGNGTDPDVLRQLRDAAPDVSLVIVADGRMEDEADPARDSRSEPDARSVRAAGADAYFTWQDSAVTIAACVRGLVERTRLRAELHRYEYELRAAEARFRSIIQRTADGIVILSEDSNVEFVNPAAERLFGRPAAELLGNDFGFPVVNGETTEMDIVRPGEDGELVAELRVSATTWNGASARLVSLRDVTDRKRAEERAHRLVVEQAAREHAENVSRRARFIAEASAVLDSSLDPNATLLSLARLIVPRVADWCVIDLVDDDRIRRVAGVHADPEKQALLEELKQQFPPYADSPQPSARVVRTGATEVHRGLTPDRLRKLTVNDAHAELLLRLGTRSSMTIPLRARETVIGAITFVCSERDFDEADVGLGDEIAIGAARAVENARLYEAALAANRSKANFLAVMSHELRTPLNAIIGYTELLLTGICGELVDDQKTKLHRVHSSATHLLQLIEEILTFAQMDTGNEYVKPYDSSLREIVDQVVAIAEPLARERGLEMHVHAPDPHVSVFTDPRKLRQIMLNLLSNAVKFTQQGSVTLTVELSGDELVVAVADTGIGIAPEDMEAIFRPFWQAEGPLTRHAGGTGLGLSVSRRLAELLGGSITVVSQPDLGSTFTLRIPCGPRGPGTTF